MKSNEYLEELKYTREYQNIKRMAIDIKKYAYKNPINLTELTDKEQIELIYILNSIIGSCLELKRLYRIKEGGDTEWQKN